MRALLTAFGSRGDMQPMLALAHGLRAAGHEATIAGPPNFKAWVESHGFRFIGFGPDIEVALQGFGPLAGIRLLRTAMGAQFALIDAARESEIIVGAPPIASAASLGEAAGVPYVCALFSPQWLPSRFHCPPVALTPIPQRLNRLMWWMLGWTWNLMFLATINRGRAALGLARTTDYWTALRGQWPLLASDDALARLPPDSPGGVVRSGPWILAESEQLEPGLEEFLRAGPPPVYIGFGSMTDRHPEQTSDLIVRAIEAAGVRALVSIGWAKLGGEKLPPTMRVVGPTPHSKLFPRCSMVVHHGGAGTTTTAARAGVPQIVVPHFFDQFQWGDWAQTAGVAPQPLIRRRLTAKGLEGAIRQCLVDETMKDRARQLPALLTYDGVAQTVLHLEGVVARWPSRKTVSPLRVGIAAEDAAALVAGVRPAAGED